jgi:hypothetical protein
MPFLTRKQINIAVASVVDLDPYDPYVLGIPDPDPSINKQKKEEKP